MPLTNGTHISVEPLQNNESEILSTGSRAKRVTMVDSDEGALNPVSVATGIGDGSKAVTTAGTRERLVAASTPCKRVDITAKNANTGAIFIGGATVSSTSGAYLYAGDNMRLDIDDLYKIYIDSSVNGEGVQFTYLT